MAAPVPTDDEPSTAPDDRSSGSGAAGEVARWRDDPSRVLIAVAGVVALAVRVAWVLWVGDRPPTSIFIDPARYLSYAESIAHGDGYVDGLGGEATAYYPPGYPYFLGLLRLAHRVLPGDPSFLVVVGLAQAVIGAAVAPLGGVVARRVVSPATGVVAAFALALYPNLILHTGAVLGETLYDTLFMAFLALAVGRWASGTPNAGRAAVVGIPLTVAVLVRPISLAVLPVLAACWWLRERDLRRTLVATAAVVGVLLVALVPWTVRNAVRMDAFVPMSTNTGDNLCIGHNPIANGGFTPCAGDDGPHRGSESELRNDDDKTDQALTWIRGNLREEPRLAWLRFRRTFFDGDHDALDAVQSYPNPALGTEPWMASSTERTLRRLADGTYGVVALVGLVGIVRLARSRWPDGLLVVLAGVATAAVPLLFFGDARFKVPVMPILCIAAAAAVTWPWAGRDGDARPAAR